MAIRIEGVPVFVYHGLADRHLPALSIRERKYWITQAELAWQLKWIRENQIEIVLLDALNVSSSTERSTRTVSITFDDGNRSDYEFAFPLLMNQGVKAHFFVNTATVGQPGFLDWPEIAEMSRSGMSIQSHNHDHVYLSRVAPQLAKDQMARSKAIIEDRIGFKVKFIAVPYGDFNGQVLRLATKIGYQALCTGRSLPALASRGFIDRTVIYGGMSQKEFSGLATASAVSYSNRMVRAGLKQIPKRIWLAYRQARMRLPKVQDQGNG